MLFYAEEGAMLMFAHVTGLRYWKSERADLTTCEDALCYDVSRGLFCVADGAGTTLFSNLWADMLVKQFVSDPLMSSDPFEMEWWIRLVQKQYQAATAPKLSKLDWNAKQKAVDQGAYSTLAALRVVQQTAQSLTVSRTRSAQKPQSLHALSQRANGGGAAGRRDHPGDRRGGALDYRRRRVGR
jgi:serine/threonine protein phosphatase PrpC